MAVVAAVVVTLDQVKELVVVELEVIEQQDMDQVLLEEQH